MRAYYGSKISPNQLKTTDGFLVAQNVPISRTGKYQYLGHELGLDHDNIVDVYRSPEEVFSPAAMASFEGKPLVDGHPPDGVNPDNAQMYVRGVAQNIRRGQGAEADLLLADLVVYDKFLQDSIKNGKREVSAGYEYDLVPNDDGTYSQKNIVGNHVAVVPDGRAGSRVRIKDQRSVFVRPGMKRHDELVSMIDGKSHNHLSPWEIRRALREGGEYYELTKVSPDGLAIEDEDDLTGVRNDFDPDKARPIIVGKDGYVIDGRHRVASAKKSGVKQMDAYVPAGEGVRQTMRSHDEQVVDEAIRQYQADAEKKSPCDRYKNDDGSFKNGFDGAVDYFKCRGYSEEVAKKIAGKIAAEQGKDEAPGTQKKEARDHMSKKIKLPLPRRSRVTDFLAAMGLKQYAMDADPEELRDAVDEMVKERSEDESGNDFPVPTVNETKAKDADGGNAAAAEEIDDLKKQIAELRGLLDKAMKGKADDEDPEKKIDDAIAQMENPEENTTGNEEETHTIDPTLITDENGVIAPPDERPQNGFTAMDRAARVSALRALKPVIAAIPDPAQRKKAADQAIAAIMAPPKNNTYAQIAGGTRKTASDTRAAAVQRQDESQLGRDWAKKFNPHYKERA